METALQKTEKTLGRLDEPKEYYRSLLNILDDFSTEKEKSEQLQQASMNLLEDFNEERINSQRIQQAMLNLLDDMNTERTLLQQAQRAVINILEDIEAERLKVEQSKLLLESANKELEAFAYSVSHDLQAPLRAITGFAQVIVEDYAAQLDGEGQRYLRLVQDNAHLMGQLIQDLLSFSRLGRQQMGLSPINMELLAKDTFENLKALMPDRKVQFRLDHLPPALGDLAMIRQIFVNLLSNALKFTRGKEIAFIEVGFRQERSNCVYYVKDNGAGFDMRYVDKLFGVFQRLHTVEEFEGTGIGLALVKRIVTRHGGRIWAEGAVNEGACFYFTLSKDKDDGQSNNDRNSTG